MERIEALGDDGTAPVDRLAEPVQHAPQEARSHRHFRRPSLHQQPAAGSDALRVAQRHQENPIAAETDHLGQHRSLSVLLGDFADLADGRHRSVTFHDDADGLGHATVDGQ